jgi:hypothetical protein
MASIDDVFVELKDLSAKLWRGYFRLPSEERSDRAWSRTSNGR